MKAQIKRGTVREDGKIFWSYNRGNEYWVTPDKFEFNQTRNGKWAKENPNQNRINARNWNRANRQQYNANKNRSAKRNPLSTKGRQLRIKFNISIEEYNQLLDLQNNKCAICQDKCPTGRQLAVDHDHKTKKVRGLLCMECNIGLGKFKDSDQLLSKAISYLLKKSS
jgi:hypothetical protein